MSKLLSSNSFKVSVAPEAGADATTYWLSPSVTQVKRTVTGTHMPDYVTCTSMAKTGDESPVSGIGTIRFVIVYKSGSSSSEAIYSSNIVVTSDMAAISFRLYLGAIQMDEKTVLVVDDGVKGDQGRVGRMPFPSGVWDISIPFTATDDVAPVVLYEPGNMYYVMNKSVTVTGLNPANDYAENGTSATWLPFESYQAIFTNILMANFAKLASGVFWGDHMFSQQGIDANGISTIAYENFGTANFTPNFQINFRTGAGHMAAGNIIFDENGKVKTKDLDITDGRIKEYWKELTIDDVSSSTDFIFTDYSNILYSSSDGNVLANILIYASNNLTLGQVYFFKIINISSWAISVKNYSGDKFKILTEIGEDMDIKTEFTNVSISGYTRAELFFIPRSIVNNGLVPDYYIGDWGVMNYTDFTNLNGQGIVLKSKPL